MQSVSSDIQHITHFLQAFRQRETTLLRNTISVELPVYRDFFQGFTGAEGRAARVNAQQAPAFNLFNILAIHHLEASVHTPLLAEFLRPDGVHGQERLFFDAFIGRLFNKAYFNEALANIYVSTELHDRQTGRMDIVIEYTRGGLPHGIIIENKIYAPDGPRQLEDYVAWLRKGYPQGQYHLLYLTPYCALPSTGSLSLSIRDELVTNGAFTCWGYHEDIASIFQSVLEKVQAPVVQHSLKQYIQIIERL